MPNHIINRLKFVDISKEEKDFILKTITTINDEDIPVIDFDKIIPEPRTKDECPEDCLTTPDSHVEESERKTMVRLVQMEKQILGH
jgi:DNA replication initiation complex subunit (GINS family)